MNNAVCRTTLSLMLAILLVCIAMPALAKVTAEEAARLKTELTPMGSEIAGNKEGTIPAWTGGLSKTPEGIDYVPKSGLPHPDPFADDKILFTITAQNVEQYKDKLSAGVANMFKLYPDTFKIHVYPTRRSAAYTKHVYEGTYKNALTAEVIDEYGSVTNFVAGFPFPIPKSGTEAMLNMVHRPWPSKNMKGTYGGGIVQGSGKYAINYATDYFLHKPEGDEPFDPADYIYGKIVVMDMPGRVGEIYLMMDPADYSKNDAIGWSYIPGMRRVRRNPNMFYDGLDSSAGGIGCSDGSWMWKGKLDRFDWKLVGKKEMYIPYNTYKIELLPEFEPMMTPHHPNPEPIRWELHRVWEVIGTLKEGSRHLYGKRHYFLDEDSWLIAVIDKYDKRGNLWRMSWAHGKEYYDFPVFRQTQYHHFDFQVAFYATFTYFNGFPPEEYNEIPDDFFSVQNLRKMGRR